MKRLLFSRATSLCAPVVLVLFVALALWADRVESGAPSYPNAYIMYATNPCPDLNCTSSGALNCGSNKNRSCEAQCDCSHTCSVCLTPSP